MTEKNSTEFYWMPGLSSYKSQMCVKYELKLYKESTSTFHVSCVKIAVTGWQYDQIQDF